MKILFATVAVLLCSCAAHADDVDFSKDVLPILSNKCFVCHGPDTQDKDELRLDTQEGAYQDRGGYKAIDSTSPKNSRLLTRIHSAHEPMPPADAEKQLTTTERDILSRWVQQGGTYEAHWAFQSPTRDTSIATRDGVDHYIQKQLQQQAIDFAPESDKSTLARRVSLILVGLPPEPKQLQRFLADNSPDAYERYVDTLFDNKHFGEHQARYWLDAVRYGDTHGLHLDNKRGIYPYRDWVVKALNDNLPLDDFITWQLAGDLLPNPTLEQLVATGYVRLNPTTGEGGAIPAEFQMKNNFDRVETLGTVFLGMSLTCVRCHTHKYDPIPHTDYYRLLAYFNSTAEPAMDRNKYEYGPTVKVPKDQSTWKTWQQIATRQTELIQKATQQIESEQLPASAREKWNAASTINRLGLLANSKTEFAALNLARPASEISSRTSELQKSFTTSLIAKDLAKPRETKVLKRGEYDQPIGPPVQPGVLSIIGGLPADAPSNRLGLSQWLTSKNHPLVTRVLINRIWQNTMGYGLVRTPEDFGLQGEQPTHPQLLDWLAVELVESDWDMRHMLRLMVTSRTFRQSSKWRTDVDDPENRFFARASSYRLDAEVLRDIGLWSSELLDPHMGGEGVKPYQPGGMWKALAHPGSNTKQYVKDTGPLLYRRSLYVYWKRTSPHPMMTLFDAPDRESSCVRRSRTNTSLQSLGLLNETQRVEMARTLAQRTMIEATTTSDRMDRIFLRLASRKPDPTERSACNRLLSEMKAKYKNNTSDAADLLTIGDARRNDSLDVVEHAAWTQVAATILASDVAILLY